MKKIRRYSVLLAALLALSGCGSGSGGGSNGGNTTPDPALPGVSVGSLDAAFGQNGIVTTPVGTAADELYALAPQSDGKIVAAGRAKIDDYFRVVVARYNTDGSLDANFGSGGKTVTPVGDGDGNGNAVAIQADGKIVVAGTGYKDPDPPGFVVTRYNADGTPDSAFGTDGVTITLIGAGAASAWAVAVQTDGKIVAAGYTSNGTYDVAVIRYQTDGTLDETFGAGGKVITQVGSLHDYANTVEIQLDGRIIVAGQTMSGAPDYLTSYALVRYNPDGSLDAGFGTGGKVVTAVGSKANWAVDVALQPDGKILTVGSSIETPLNYDVSLVRYNPDGSLDTSFNGTGTVRTPVGTGADYAAAVALQTDGKIVVAGSSSNGTDSDAALVRYNADGTVDAGFNGTGKVATALGPGGDYFNAVFIQPDGKIVAAGGSSNGADDDFVLVRYMP